MGRLTLHGRARVGRQRRTGGAASMRVFRPPQSSALSVRGSANHRPSEWPAPGAGGAPMMRRSPAGPSQLTSPAATSSARAARTSSGVQRTPRRQVVREGGAVGAESIEHEPAEASSDARTASSVDSAVVERLRRPDRLSSASHASACSRRNSAIGVAPTTCVGPLDSRAQDTSPARHSVSSRAGV